MAVYYVPCSLSMYAFKVTSFNYLGGFIEEMGVFSGLSTYPFSLLDQHLRKNFVYGMEVVFS